MDVNDMNATIIDKINKFENLPRQTVAEFNLIFTEQALEASSEALVEIGAILGPVNRRELRVGGISLPYDFHIPTEDPYSPNRLGYVKKGTDDDTNANLENTMLEERELEMDPFEYFLLQYFRGSLSNIHTQSEIAARIKKSAKGVGNVIRRMEENGIIEVVPTKLQSKIEVIVKEEWL